MNPNRNRSLGRAMDLTAVLILEPRLHLIAAIAALLAFGRP